MSLTPESSVSDDSSSEARSPIDACSDDYDEHVGFSPGKKPRHTASPVGIELLSDEDLKPAHSSSDEFGCVGAVRSNVDSTAPLSRRQDLRL